MLAELFGHHFTSYVRHPAGGKIEHVQSRVPEAFTTPSGEQIAAGTVGTAVKFFAADFR
ncbi:MAG TPA: hypothetical protein PLX99_09870 [Gammaproteobacteria bacterium]|nr:hypothetical protein [Gammaproteobacteria bacterium]